MSDSNTNNGDCKPNEASNTNCFIEGSEIFTELVEETSIDTFEENTREPKNVVGNRKNDLASTGSTGTENKNITNSSNKDIEESNSKNQVLPKNTELMRKDPFLSEVSNFHLKQPFFYDRSKTFWFWDFETYRWVIVDEVDLMNELDELQISHLMTTNPNIRNQYIEAFRRVGRKFKPEEAPKHYVQFNDTIVDLKTGVEFRASPDIFVTNPIPYSLIHNQETPLIDKFIADWVGKNKVRQLKQIIAFCMVPDYPLSRIFCFIGGGRNGKSTFMELVQKFLGEYNYCSSELDQIMTGRFELAKLYKKLACFMGETNFNTMSKTNRLKQLSGRDPISIEFKNKNPFDSVNYAKLLISTNGLPRSNDNSDGFYRRWLIIDFPNQFTEAVDVLGMIPESEFEALTGQCLKLLKELLESGKFDNEGTVEERAKMYEKMSDPVQVFIDSELIVDYDSNVVKSEFKERLDYFCIENKYRKIGVSELGKLMNSKGFRAIRPYIINDEGKEVKTPCFEGLRFKDQETKPKNTEILIIEEFIDNGESKPK